ncbi:sulfate permease ii [Pyrenophora seminiperda CCB06]|uniref:Sulfate permease ii n=1 Tax=Pyrenophora seminiperda CCB06 TaxID=1302712 RepID=A0A3M7M2S3_9PLEO|nr:sulfate permease ii [Pyrenophora seminiperda CCB06]
MEKRVQGVFEASVEMKHVVQQPRPSGSLATSLNFDFYRVVFPMLSSALQKERKKNHYKCHHHDIHTANLPSRIAARLPENDDLIKHKGLLNGTDFDRADMLNGTKVIPGVTLATSSTMDSAEGMIGSTPEPKSSAGWADEGILGPKPTPKPSVKPIPRPRPNPQIPIVALTYAGAGGPKHCRGELLAKTFFPRPIEKWKNGTCINLPSEARCGVFFSSKGDNCEAALFNTADCYNTTQSYVNTVVFMPEERAVGALWSSMWVRCAVEVPEAKMLDPAILGGALKPKPKPGGG